MSVRLDSYPHISSGLQVHETQGSVVLLSFGGLVSGSLASHSRGEALILLFSADICFESVSFVLTQLELTSQPSSWEFSLREGFLTAV